MVPNLYNETMIKGVFFLCFKTVFMRTETLKKAFFASLYRLGIGGYN